MGIAQLKLVSQLPDYIPEQEWRDYLEMRRRKKKPLLESTQERVFEKLWRLKNDGHPVGLVLRQSVDMGWVGLFAPSRAYLDGF
jgi:hypothetical protein